MECDERLNYASKCEGPMRPLVSQQEHQYLQDWKDTCLEEGIKLYNQC